MVFNKMKVLKYQKKKKKRRHSSSHICKGGMHIHTGAHRDCRYKTISIGHVYCIRRFLITLISLQVCISLLKFKGLRIAEINFLLFFYLQSSLILLYFFFPRANVIFLLLMIFNMS